MGDVYEYAGLISEPFVGMNKRQVFNYVNVLTVRNIYKLSSYKTTVQYK